MQAHCYIVVDSSCPRRSAAAPAIRTSLSAKQIQMQQQLASLFHQLPFHIRLLGFCISGRQVHLDGISGPIQSLCNSALFTLSFTPAPTQLLGADILQPGKTRRCFTVSREAQESSACYCVALWNIQDDKWFLLHGTW